MSRSIKYFFIEIFKKFPRQFIFLLIFLLIESLVLASSVLTIVPLADYLLDPSLSNPSKITEITIKILSIFNLEPNYLIFGAIFIFTNFVRSFFALLIKYFSLKIKYSIVKNLTTNLLRDIFSSKWAFFSNLGPGKLLNTLNKELPRVGDATGHLATMVSMFIQLVTYLVIPLTLDFKLTVYTLTISIILGLPFLLLNKISHKLGKLNTSTANRLIGIMNETLQAAKIILGFGNRKKAILDHADAMDQHIDATIKSQVISSLTNLFFKPLAILAIIISIGISVQVDKNISEYVAIFWSLYAVIPVLANLFNTSVVINNFIPSYEQLEEIRNKAFNNKEILTGKVFDNFKEKIIFNKISFNYLNKKSVIHNCSFEIKKNIITAIVGKSGSGKSTIIDLLLGLQKPNGGQIYFDNTDLNSFNLDSYRKKISFVSQDPFLFYATIRENLMWSNSEVTEKDIIESLKIANVYETVMNLPSKLDTYVGERGLELSGGERQRIILARGILRKPQLLILDEATSSLDQNSELLINQSIKKITEFSTVLIIAHRSSTINIANQIYVLKDGKMIESGSLEKLRQEKNSEFLKITQA
tara:strand:- start:4957 stop:6717 length:1761 start_codon:yes stop_codon:yes gene_type:complete